MTIKFKETYEPLTEAAAINLAHNLHFFEKTSKLFCKEIGDGNLNLVFHIQDENKKGIIIKQALPYAKVVGESWPLSLHRATIEANYLRKASTIVPHLVPKVYYSNERLAITVMEDLSHLQIVRTGFNQGKNFPLLAKDIGEYLAKTLFYTSDYGLDQQEKKELQRSFVNPDLCKITEDLVFTDPLFDNETNDFEPELQDTVEALWQDGPLKLEVAKLKYKFLTKAEALLHGDLHTGSIFANETETKVIDPEFAYYGPIGFDIGQFFANLLFQALRRNKEERKPILTHLEQVWESFQDTFTQLWKTSSVEAYTKTNGYLEHVLQQIFRDSLGFAGCELIRRTIGLAHVADLDTIEPYSERINTKKQALAFGRNLILHQAVITTPESAVEWFKKETKEN